MDAAIRVTVEHRQSLLMKFAWIRYFGTQFECENALCFTPNFGFLPALKVPAPYVTDRNVVRRKADYALHGFVDSENPIFKQAKARRRFFGIISTASESNQNSLKSKNKFCSVTSTFFSEN